MTERELDAAGITEPALRDAYRLSRRLNARHGKTYFLATRLLPLDRRPAVHALYGFARWADDIVDDPGAPGAPGDPAGPGGPGDPAGADRRAAALDTMDGHLASALRTGTGEGTGTGAPPVVRALAHTAARYAIDHRHFADFMASMRSDLTVTRYPTYADLHRYMHGSAAVIGLQMLPVLGTVVPREEAAPHAAALGVAFQLTNFLRDVGEDLDRGRVYLPEDLLGSFGVDRALLRWSRDTGRADPRVTAALAAALDLTRGVYRRARPGLDMLDPRARPCIRTAFVLYGAILETIADNGFDVLHRRAVVPRRRRAVLALDGVSRVAAVRLRAAYRAPHPGARPQDRDGRPGPHRFARHHPAAPAPHPELMEAP
ncbi:phytoene/squalene synthase family protein [Streptomyces tubbatahanensis]|uniref:Phytoene/squalene synthase family protein n=1 Tax=Streptomyces tubbatahanensis TaxID=2923272 RepID=A0ABY3XP13_9ACTN|nr:phytoene/squalene synthase family protein [Streptomyces tubbatahanensis]UNS96114.1 phytoene/squalene synthase family protein [Streptomyces tubbatahanensis]